MNLGQTLLNEDLHHLRYQRVSRAMRQHRADHLALHGCTETAIAAVLQKHGPMTRNLLFVAIPDRLPATISRMVNRMTVRGAVTLEARGAIEVFRLTVGTQ